MAGALSAPERRWIGEDCIWVNSLVDRIVSQPLEPLGAVAEPYALWAIEDRPGLLLPCRHSDIVVTKDLKRYERLKLFILNLGHTFLAEIWRAAKMRAGHDGARGDGRSGDIAPTSTTSLKKRSFRFSPASAWRPRRGAYRDTVIDRFRNPFLQHRLAEIFTNHEAKKQRRFGGLIALAEAHELRLSQPRLRAALASHEGALSPQIG